MFQDSTKSRLLLLIALIIGSIGAISQSWLLYHKLVNCYPYKMMDAEFYSIVANIGVCLAPFIAIVSGLLFGLKRLWLTPIILVILCPLMFATVFKTASVVSKWNGTDVGWNFDGTTPEMAAQEFFYYTVSLAITGLIIGAFSSFLLARLSKPRKLA